MLFKSYFFKVIHHDKTQGPVIEVHPLEHSHSVSLLYLLVVVPRPHLLWPLISLAIIACDWRVRDSEVSSGFSLMMKW